VPALEAGERENDGREPIEDEDPLRHARKGERVRPALAASTRGSPAWRNALPLPWESGSPHFRIAGNSEVCGARPESEAVNVHLSRAGRAKHNRPRRRTAEEKLQLVLKAASLSEEGLWAFLRSEGLHEAMLEGWRAKAMEAATSS